MGALRSMLAIHANLQTSTQETTAMSCTQMESVCASGHHRLHHRSRKISMRSTNVACRRCTKPYGVAPRPYEDQYQRCELPDSVHCPVSVICSKSGVQDGFSTDSNAWRSPGVCGNVARSE